MSRVTRTDGFEAYTVRAGYRDQEWATIVIRGWQAPGNDGRPREIGEIMVHSSYGSWAYQWGHLGCPFKSWLAECTDRSYVAEKFLGSKAYVFDGDTTVKELRRRLIKWRRDGSLDHDRARAVWDWIEDYEGELSNSEHEFCERMQSGLRDCEMDDAGPRVEFFDDPWELTARTIDHGFAGFWREIMPAFQQALRDEIATTKEPA